MYKATNESTLIYVSTEMLFRSILREIMNEDRKDLLSNYKTFYRARL